jgi:hypothetical protein
MTTIFGNHRNNVLIRTGKAETVHGNVGSNIRLGGDGHNFAVRNVATASIAFALSVTLIGITCAQTATAVPLRLKGAYGFTGSAACLVAPGSTVPPGPNPTPGIALPNSGFDPVTLRPIDGKVFSRSFAVEGIRTFNGDGTGTVKGTAVAVTVPPTPQPPGFPNFPPSASSADFSYSFTYTVDGTGAWTSNMVPGSYLENHLTGPRAGQTSTVDAIPPIVGMISQDGKTLTGAHITTAVETQSFSNGDVDPQICHRSRVYVRLGDD